MISHYWWGWIAMTGFIIGVSGYKSRYRILIEGVGALILSIALWHLGWKAMDV